MKLQLVNHFEDMSTGEKFHVRKSTFFHTFNCILFEGPSVNFSHIEK